MPIPASQAIPPIVFAAVWVAAAAQADVLNAPVTVNANNSTSGLTVNQAGTGRGALVSIQNASNGLSALRGQTNGRGAGVHGLNSGTTGPAGYFEQTNADSRQTAVVVKAAGIGDAVRVESSGPGFGLVVKRVRSADGRASAGTAIYAENTTFDTHVPALATAIEARGGGTGLWAKGDQSAGVWGTSEFASGVVGESQSYQGVTAYSGTGSALFARSLSGLAGEFEGPVKVSGPVRAASFQIVSDRDQKQDFEPVDGQALLDRLAELPMTRWAYKATPEVQHLGPMAQDFREAFHLGSDERHIEVVDAAGVSLAAVQALLQQLKARDAQIAVQQARLDALEARVVAMSRDTAETLAARSADSDTVALPSSTQRFQLSPLPHLAR